MVRSVQLATEGSFLCEVSGEAPLFQTAKKGNFLTVVGKQQAEPAIIIMFFVEYHAIMGFCPSNIFFTPLHQAACNGQVSMLVFLAEIVLK